MMPTNDQYVRDGDSFNVSCSAAGTGLTNSQDLLQITKCYPHHKNIPIKEDVMVIWKNHTKDEQNLTKTYTVWNATLKDDGCYNCLYNRSDVDDSVNISVVCTYVSAY